MLRACNWPIHLGVERGMDERKRMERKDEEAKIREKEKRRE